MNISELLKRFTQLDAERRSGVAGPGAAIQDRMNEGALMAGLLGPLAPAATLPVAAAGAGYEGLKWLGQKTGAGQYFPGPFRVDQTTSPASVENILALLKGYTEK